jgi:hypothetical protein
MSSVASMDRCYTLIIRYIKKKKKKTGRHNITKESINKQQECIKNQRNLQKIEVLGQNQPQSPKLQ